MKILTLDDHDVSRKGVGLYCRKVFGEDTEIFEASNCKQLLTLLSERMDFDMYVFDLFVEDELTIPMISVILSKNSQAKILVVSMANENVFGVKAMKEGAMGFVSKIAKEEEVCKAIKMVSQGEVYISRGLFSKSKAILSPDDKELNRFNKLSNLEIKVLTQMVNGKTTSEIAKLLFLKATTVSTIKSRIFEKLGTSRINEIIKIYRFNDFS